MAQEVRSVHGNFLFHSLLLCFFTGSLSMGCSPLGYKCKVRELIKTNTGSLSFIDTFCSMYNIHYVYHLQWIFSCPLAMDKQDTFAPVCHLSVSLLPTCNWHKTMTYRPSFTSLLPRTKHSSSDHRSLCKHRYVLKHFMS